MVRHALLLLLLFPVFCQAITPKVRAEVHPSLPLIKGELQGMLSVYHSPSDRLDDLEAQMEQKPLPLLFLFSAPLSAEERALYPEAKPTDLVSVYRFQIPLSEPGIYPLPSISVKVGKQWLRTIPSNYQVMPGPLLPFLQLQAFVSPSLSLYPGQRARFVYRMTYNHSMKLVIEELPLLRAKGFEKIGSEQIEEKTLPRATMQEITQQVRAKLPGSYPFGRSRIAGKLQDEKMARGDKALLEDIVEPITVQVLPFPKFRQPFFFEGALAPVSIQTGLMTRDTVRIGDLTKLAIDITSSEETLETFSPPDLNCQVGFRGFFGMDPQIQIQPIDSKTRRYIYYLHPLSYHINAIPAVEIAAFDPHTHSYVRARSEPILLHIQIPEETPHARVAFNPPQPLSDGPWTLELKSQNLIDTSNLKAVEQTAQVDTRLRFVFLYALLLGLLLLAQQLLRPYLMHFLTRFKPSLSSEFLQEEKWREALLFKLYEEKWISSPNIEPEALPAKGLPGTIREFLLQLERLRFGKEEPKTAQIKSNALKDQAYQLYAAIKRRT